MNSELAVTDRTAAYLETQQTVAALAAAMTAAAVKAAHAQLAILDVAEPLQERQSLRVIDPEALLLVSLWLTPRDPSLRPVVHAWVEAWSDLLSVQRTRNIARTTSARRSAEARGTR